MHKTDMVIVKSGGSTRLGQLQWFVSFAVADGTEPLHLAALLPYELIKTSSRRQTWKPLPHGILCELQHIEGAVSWAAIGDLVVSLKPIR